MALARLAGLGNLPEKLGDLARAYAEYWQALPKSAGVPMKRALDPGAMRRFIASFVIVERRSPQVFTIRLAGSAVRELSGVELTGTDALALRDGEQREKGTAAYEAQLATPCGAWGIVIGRSAAGFHVPSEVMVFPLRDDDGSLRFLGGTIEPCSPAVRPDRAGAAEAKMLSWPEHRFIDIGFGLPKFPRGAR